MAEKRIYAVQSSLQKSIVHMYNTLKNDREEMKRFSTETAIIIHISKLMGLGVTSIKKYIGKWKKGEKLTTPGKKKRQPKKVTNIDDFTKEAIVRFMSSELRNGKAITVKDVFNHMKEDPDTFLFSGSLSSLRTVIKELGFEWKKHDKYHYLKLTDDIILKRHWFLMQYMKNTNCQNPLPVIFLDETWIFINGKPPLKSWGTSTEKPAVLRRPGEGKRLVVVHAGSKSGFVPGADLVSVTNLKSEEDYPGAMNSSNFEKWVVEKLLVGIRSLGKCLIIMDNASYHSRLLDKQPTTKWRKDQLLMWLNQNGIFPPDCSRKDHLQMLCNKHRNHLKRYVVDDLLMKEGHQILRLPPYHCEFNPIELVWGITKEYYNKNVTQKPGQGLDRAKQVWKEALNQIWEKCVRHCEKTILDAYEKEVKGTPEVEEFIISHQESDTEESSDDNFDSQCDADIFDDIIPLSSVSGETVSAARPRPYCLLLFDRILIYFVYCIYIVYIVYIY